MPAKGPFDICVVGGGLIGLSVAWFCACKGHNVTVIERSAPERDGCSFANAGMIVPSHFIPLASPGVVQTGLRWMWNPESPFHVQPRFSGELLDWGWKLYRAATSARSARPGWARRLPPERAAKSRSATGASRSRRSWNPRVAKSK